MFFSEKIFDKNIIHLVKLTYSNNENLYFENNDYKKIINL